MAQEDALGQRCQFGFLLARLKKMFFTKKNFLKICWQKCKKTWKCFCPFFTMLLHLLSGLLWDIVWLLTLFARPRNPAVWDAVKHLLIHLVWLGSQIKGEGRGGEEAKKVVWNANSLVCASVAANHGGTENCHTGWWLTYILCQTNRGSPKMFWSHFCYYDVLVTFLLLPMFWWHFLLLPLMFWWHFFAVTYDVLVTFLQSYLIVCRFSRPSVHCTAEFLYIWRHSMF